MPCFIFYSFFHLDWRIIQVSLRVFQLSFLCAFNNRLLSRNLKCLVNLWLPSVGLTEAVVFCWPVIGVYGRQNFLLALSQSVKKEYKSYCLVLECLLFEFRHQLISAQRDIISSLGGLKTQMLRRLGDYFGQALLSCLFCFIFSCTFSLGICCRLESWHTIVDAPLV